MIYYFVDLDNTLFQTNVSDKQKSDLEVAAVARDGSPLSYSTSKQRIFFELLCSTGCVIPISGRNYDSFSRVLIPFPSKMAILNFGGVILDYDGKPDFSYLRSIKDALVPFKSLYKDLKIKSEDLIEKYQLPLKPRIIVDFNVSFYLEYKIPRNVYDVCKINQIHNIVKEELLHPLVNTGNFYIHQNGSHLAILPKIIGKDKALHYVREQYLLNRDENTLCVGIGDSLSDVPFMTACDFCMNPAFSQIANILSNMTNIRSQEE